MEKIRLGDVATYINGYAFKPEDRGGVGLPIIRIQDLTGNAYDVGYYNGTYPENIEINDGDVLISWSASLGVYLWNRGQALLNQHIFKVVFDQKPIEKQFFIYAIQHELASMSQKTHGATMKHITKKDFENVLIVYPSIENQQQIVASLDKVNHLLEMRRRQLQLLDDIVKSRFIEMFETLDMSEERNEWETLGDLCKIYTGTTPSSKEESYWNGDVLWITPAEMSSETFYVYDTVRKITEKGRKSKSLDIMPVNTVLLSTRAPIGKVGIVGTPMACNQGFKNFECGKRLNPVFLYVLLKNNTEYLNSLGSGTTFLEVSKSKIAKTRIPVPDITKQNEFEQFVKVIDKSKFIIQQSIEKLETLQKALMQKYFG